MFKALSVDGQGIKSITLPLFLCNVGEEFGGWGDICFCFINNYLSFQHGRIDREET